MARLDPADVTNVRANWRGPLLEPGWAWPNIVRMEERLERITTAMRSALHEGQTNWSLQFLTAKDPRFIQAWDVAQQIPGWFEEINAVSQFLVIAELRPKCIVEIGSYLGRSTVFFAKTLEVLGIDGIVTAIDPHTGDRQHLENLGISELPSFEMFRSHIEATGLQDRVQAIVASSHDAVAEWTDPIDYLFIDGWHSYEAVVQDGHDWVPRLDERGVVLFDDATRISDVRRGINELVADGTIRLYGDAFGQAFAGRRPDVPPSVRTVLRSFRPLTRHIPGHRSIR